MKKEFLNFKKNYLNIHNIDDGATFLDILDIFRGGIFKVIFAGEVVNVYGEEWKIFSGLFNFGGGVQHHGDLRAGTLKDDFENTSFATSRGKEMRLIGGNRRYLGKPRMQISIIRSENFICIFFQAIIFRDK